MDPGVVVWEVSFWEVPSLTLPTAGGKSICFECLWMMSTFPLKGRVSREARMLESKASEDTAARVLRFEQDNSSGSSET
jgi:hypothetical protein